MQLAAGTIAPDPIWGTKNAPNPQFRWQEIIWTATAAKINFLDQPLVLNTIFHFVDLNSRIDVKILKTSQQA